MRVTDDRYFRDRRAFDLAWRLIKLGARTGTISRWTGIAERRVRALQQSYGSHEPGGAGTLKRPRGQSPYRIDRLLHTLQRQQDGTRFARLCKRTGALPSAHLADVDRMLPGIERGELLCRSFEIFKHDFPNSTLSIEQAVLLLTELVRRDEIGLEVCDKCGDVAIVDRLQPDVHGCAICGNGIESRTVYANQPVLSGERVSCGTCRKPDIDS